MCVLDIVDMPFVFVWYVLSVCW